jgi:hypothetical protein
VHTFSYSIVPFVLLLIFNGFLIYVTVKRKRSVEGRKKLALSVTVISMTISFILFTLPTAIVSTYFDTFEFALVSLEHVKIVTSNAITYSYHAFNFFILYNTNKRFVKEFKAMFTEIKLLKPRPTPPVIRINNY